MTRKKQVLGFDNKNDTCLYLMTKTFRIYNNYSLDEALKYAKTNSLELHICLLEPFEINQTNLKFFYGFTDDLLEQLYNFTKHVNLVKRVDSKNCIMQDISAIFIDKPYLKFDLEFYQFVKMKCYAEQINLFTVESNVFVPVQEVTDKEEYSARTIRKKINQKLSFYRDEVLTDRCLAKAEIESFKLLNDFIKKKLENYHLHNDPSLDYTSLLSPYLKYGFISPVSIYNKMAKIHSENKDSFLEELIVRRELAYNYVYYNSRYDDFKYITYDWAYQTMKHHLNDKREYIYTKEDYINFRTHDKYFNACMKEMIYLGRMHSYMRMYWCKKIIEWSTSYEEAFEIAIGLNNYYFLDGLTPNGYCGVAWCFGKHDRAWTERNVFGKIRYMNANGLERKFNIEDYVKRMDKEESRRIL
ncbi:MAG: hypothetical protein WC152_04990 [Candidatus Izemoplasmatales bacterium]